MAHKRIVSTIEEEEDMYTDPRPLLQCILVCWIKVHVWGLVCSWAFGRSC